MKPDWSKAPKNATYWAMDLNGSAYWYKNKPKFNARTGVWDPRGEFAVQDLDGSFNPEKSLQKRPK